MPSPLRAAALQLRTAKRLLRRHDGSVRTRIGALDDRLVFVLGCSRSGTTFLARAIGSLPGFVDLGEVAPVKAALPELAALPEHEAAPRLRRLLRTTRRLAFLGNVRAVEQTPECVFVAPALARAFPEAQLLHIVRDGRDVVCSLLERGWLSAGRRGRDDAGNPYGARPRFWVEDGRSEEFETAGDARRAAWAWRRYLTAARAAPRGRVHELRYERMIAEPEAVAAELAHLLDAPSGPLAEALGSAHGSSVGRWKRDLTAAQLAEVESECGDLLAVLGYATSPD